MTSPFDHLPAAVRARLGELDTAWPDEPRSDCAHCPLVVAGEQGLPHPYAMVRDARCCTAQPQLANFLVGRVADAAVVRARIANRDGVSAWGIRAETGYDAAFPQRAKLGFGRDLTMRCHFWVGGDHACGVWSGRSARCRAFFCRHERGLSGALSWSQAAGVGVSIEAAIADHLVAVHGGPTDDSDDALLAWYARCAREADALDAAAAVAIVRRVPPADPDAPADRIAHSERGRLITRLRAHQPRLGDVLVPAVSAVLERDDGHVWLAGYSTFDAVRVPASVFGFLAKLDGTTRWRDALGGDIDEGLVRELHRVGALRDPAGSDDPPGTE